MCMYIDGVVKEVKMGMGLIGVRFTENGIKQRLPGLLYVDNPVLWGGELDLEAMQYGL